MGGLLLLLVAVAWFAASLVLATWLSHLARSSLGRVAAGSIAFVAILVAPFADDLIGTAELKRYCDSSPDVLIHRTIVVDPVFYGANGEWLLGISPVRDWDTNTRLTKLADSLVEWDHGNHAPIPGLHLIEQRTTKIYEKVSNALVAEWTSYAYRGGVVRRSVLPSSTECRPPLMRQGGSQLYNRIFRVSK